MGFSFCFLILVFSLPDEDGSIIIQSVGSVSEPSPAQQHLSDNVVSEANSALSLWLQWTLPQLTLALLAADSTSKLLLEMEDWQSSFDWTPLYFQTK